MSAWGQMRPTRRGTCLRQLDELGAKEVYARCPDKEGVGLAVYNRLIRAAAYHELPVEQE